MTDRDARFHLRVEDVTDTLVQRFGRPTLGNKRNPFNELLYIILSSRTPPSNYQATYRSLRRRFPRADDLAEANPDDVAEAIELGGLHNKKARAIVAIASELGRQFGRVTLAPLKRMETPEAERFLVSLPGVRTKTARCVLMYALDRPVFPVDRHCFRIAQRLQWAPQGVDLTKRRADDLQSGVPEPLRRDLHVGMVLLGRRYCLPRDPLCRECPLLQFCPTSAAFQSPEGQASKIP
jgi:endonuclease-3